jgi:pheromone shutdown-related protein TraB
MLESVLADMRKQFPKIGDILVGERDQYLASKIREAPGEKVVAILGGAHVPGVKKQIFETQDIDSISEVPPKSPASQIVGWIIPIAIIGLIAYSFVANVQTGLQQLTSWVLWNGVLAALFTALSQGHPLSIVTSFVVAPISSLNPLLACGWFSGLVEATIRKPTVQDVNQIPSDIISLRGFFKNGFLRILLVVIMANLGSTIGTVVAGMDIIKNLI